MIFQVRHGKEEQNGFCLVTLPEYNLLSYMKNKQKVASIAESTLGLGFHRMTQEVLTTSFLEQERENTQFPIYASVAATVTLKNQINKRTKHIVKCVNCHDDLLEALEEMVAIAKHYTCCKPAIQRAEVAIAKAKAKS